MNYKSELIDTITELKDIYEKLKHFPGKHNQDDHAWNAGMASKKKRSRSRSSGYSSRSGGVSAIVRNARRYSFRQNAKTSGGVLSPMEATANAASQARTLGISNPSVLLSAITRASTILRFWADEYKTALSQGNAGDAKKIAQKFKDLSKQISQLSDSLKTDAIAQNTFNAIITSYQGMIMNTIPESKKVFQDYPIYDKKTPDEKMAKTVQEQIAESRKQ